MRILLLCSLLVVVPAGAEPIGRLGVDGGPEGPAGVGADQGCTWYHVKDTVVGHCVPGQWDTYACVWIWSDIQNRYVCAPRAVDDVPFVDEEEILAFGECQAEDVEWVRKTLQDPKDIGQVLAWVESDHCADWT